MATYVSIPGSGKVDVTVYGKGTVIAGGGNDSITVLGKGFIEVGKGHDTLTLGSGGIISQLGSAGRDTIHVGSGSTTIYEQGHATVTGPFGSTAFGSATIFGGVINVSESHGVTKELAVSGKMTLLGGVAPAEFIGGTGTTSMVGGIAGDTFVGGSGHQTMVGGKGADLFEFLKGDSGGKTLIKDFVTGKDHLYLEGYSLSYLEKHGEVSSHGGNTYISLDGGKTTIELQGVTTLKGSDITGKH